MNQLALRLEGGPSTQARALDAYRGVMVRPPRETLSEWADTNRILSPEASAEAGPWRTDRVPYLREIMDTLSDPLVRKVVWVAASQVSKTEVVNNFVGFSMDRHPGPILVVQPTLNIAKAWSKDRLAPMIRDTECLRHKVKDPRTRDSGNTTLHKTFPGGRLTIVGANSPSDLAGRPIRDVLLDEVDRYPRSAGSEGDPVTLAIQRSRTFWNRKVFMVSSPGDLISSRIWPEFIASDQRRLFVPCPHCDHSQMLEWKNVKWESEEVDGNKVHRFDTAAYVCEGCGGFIEEMEKGRMLASEDWRPQNPEGRWPGFHLSALYSPWVTWAELAEMWIDAQRDRDELKTFINLQLGEPWEERDQDVQIGQLEGRAETYPAEVPNGVGALTASVDVQEDRLEVKVKGYGAREESWLITHERLYGDPEQEDVWAELRHILKRKYRHESGRDLMIRATMIDSGYLSKRVYRFVRGYEREGFYASKGGDSRLREPLSRATRKNRDGVKPWSIDTHAFKTIVFRRLRATASATAEREGPGYMHFCRPTKTGADAEYFAQFGAEVPRLIKQGRRFARVFQQIRDRNEAIDLEVYALAALYSLGDRFVRGLGELADEMREPLEESDDQSPTQPITRPGRRRGSGWVNKWKG